MDDMSEATASTIMEIREAFNTQKAFSDHKKNDLEIVRIWETIQRMDNLLRQVEATAADAITIARLLAQKERKK